MIVGDGENRPSIVFCANAAWNLVNFRAPVIRALIADRFRVVAVTPADEHVGRLREMGCEWRDMPMDNKGTSPVADGALFLRLLTLLREIKPAAFLGYTIKPNVYGVLAARLLGIPTFPNVSGLGTAFIKENWVTRVVHLLYRTAFSGATRVFSRTPKIASCSSGSAWFRVNERRPFRAPESISRCSRRAIERGTLAMKLPF